MIAVLGSLADVERDLIRTRTAEGRSRAQKRGQHMGRKPKLTEAQQKEARQRRAQGATLAGTRAQLRREPKHDFAIVTHLRFGEIHSQLRTLSHKRHILRCTVEQNGAADYEVIKKNLFHFSRRQRRFNLYQ